MVRFGWWAAAAVLFGVFACWPQFWNPSQSGLTPAGLVWYAPGSYFATGSKPWYHEFHWHGLQLLAGNSFILAGLRQAWRPWPWPRYCPCHGAAFGQGAVPQGAVRQAGARPVTDGTSLAGLRERLVNQVLATSGIRDERIAAALRDVPRHLFLPHLPAEEASLDDAIVTKRDAAGQPISSSSQPAIMAIMLDQLTLSPGQRVLEIGAGTGYNAALMRHIVGPSGTVVSIDIEANLVDRAREHLASARLSGCDRGGRGQRRRLPAGRAVRPGDRHRRGQRPGPGLAGPDRGGRPDRGAA